MNLPAKNKFININGEPKIGGVCTPYLIAEIGTNHNQDIKIARELVRQIAEAGFDCAKFQSYEAVEIVSEGVSARDYGLDKYYGDIKASEMFDKYLKTPKEWFPELRDLCHEYGIDCATTIHGVHGLAWARRMDFDIIKIASMDHNNLPFLCSLVNQINVPILISFGMAELTDIEAAVDILKFHRPGLGIFHCVSVYPPRPDELRIANIPFLQQHFEHPVGFSDHSEDLITSLIALAFGSRLFEKHVTLNKASEGPDHPYALEPDQMKVYVEGIRNLAGALDANQFQSPTDRELTGRSAYLKSIVSARDLPAGAGLGSEDITFARPGNGILPKYAESLLGRITRRPIAQGTLLSWDDLEP